MIDSNQEAAEMPDENDNQHADPVMEILYHGRGGRTHVTATFPLDQLESVVERVKAQRQCWTQAAERLLNGSASNAGVVCVGEEITQGETPQTPYEDTRPGSRVGSRVGKRLRPSLIGRIDCHRTGAGKCIELTTLRPSTTLPTPEAALTEGYWTEGNPGTGVAATLVRASFLNMVQEELRAIVVAAGETPSKTTYNQILTALKSMFSPVVGTVRNLSMSVTAASATATLTADEIIVETALAGIPFKLASFSKTINLATTGAGGMDTGTAPASGAVAIYAIYNPTTATSALLATNTTSSVAANVYGGANMPAGYTASALVSVWLTTPASLLQIGYQQDRHIAIANTNQITSSSIVTAPIAIVGRTKECDQSRL
jgi:hypothetical protein